MESDFHLKTDLRVGVLASGRGSNLEAILRAGKAGQLGRAEVCVVLSNNPAARALDTAERNGIPAFAAAPKDYPTQTAYETELLRILRERRIDLLVLAGYMKLIGPVLLDAFSQKILNIHPSLLPAFPGLNAQRQALEYGVRFAGCTVHFVDAGIDSGPIVGQRIVPVLSGDTEDTLSARILAQEHELFPATIKLLTERPWRLTGRRFETIDEDSDPESPRGTP